MILTTTDFIGNTKIKEMKGVIFSEQVQSVNVAKDFLSGMKGIFGKKLDGYAMEYKRAREDAISDLIKQAEQFDADAIINLKTYVSQFINSGIIFIVVTAHGTMVTIENSTSSS